VFLYVTTKVSEQPVPSTRIDHIDVLKVRHVLSLYVLHQQKYRQEE
jgi:hypothetical protein